MANIIDNEDLDVFLDITEFGEALTFSGGTVVEGIWSEDYVEELDIQGKKPLFLVKESDADNVAIDETTTRNSTSYTLKVKQNDGTGLTILVLEEQ